MTKKVQKARGEKLRSRGTAGDGEKPAGVGP